MIAESTHFWLGALGTAAVTVAFLYAFATDPRNRTYHAILVGITGIASVAYVLMALGVGAVEAANGSTVYVVRYVDWLATTPLIVLYLGLVAGIRRRTMAVVVALDAVMIAMALGANFVEGGAKYGLFVLATLVYAALMYYLVGGITSAVAARPPPVVALFEKLRNITVIIWSFYPVVWILGPAALGVLDPPTKVLLFTYLDFVSKALFGLIAMNSQRSLNQLPRLDALRLTGSRGE